MLSRSPIVLFGSLSLLAGLALGGCASHACAPQATAINPTSAPTLMLSPEHAAGGVGVVRRLDLLVAYYRSGHNQADLRMLRELRDEAKSAGRGDHVAAINAFGSEMQEIAHRHAAGDEPIYTVLLGVEDELRTLMVKHELGRIVEAGPGVEGLDITDELIDSLPR